ncbi:Fc.00g109940.m01.CDS01 [Cosmosporella sp. VM-42]
MNQAALSQLKNKGPKACTTCAKAKARCIPGPDGSLKCERCHRLNKPCISQTPAPPRARKSPKLSKIAALEKRLEELSSHVHESPAQTVTPSPKAETANDIPKVDMDFSHLFPVEPAAVKEVTPVPVSVPGKPRPWDSWWPTPNEADMLLQHYVNVHADLFPFVLVPQQMTAMELRQHRPFLWKAAMMVGCFLDGARQVKLGEELLAEIGRAAIVDGLKSLDLLHGLQLLVAWWVHHNIDGLDDADRMVARFHYALKGSQLTNLLFLARSMNVNLGFKEDDQGEDQARNLDHMRAYAGTYYLNTLVFTANKRPDVLMNTTYLETCCKVLETTMQYPSDEYLVKLVRIQQLAQSISLTMAIDNISQTAMKLPLTMVVRSFQDQLDSFRDSLRPQFANNDTLKSHVDIAEVLLYEIAISDQHSSASYVPLTDRLQLLWACLRALKSFFAIRFSHRELERPRFLCLSASDFVYTIITGLKLLTLQLPGWNLGHIHTELDMCEVMDSQIRDLVVIIQRRKQGMFPGGGPSSLEDPFERLLRQLKTLRDLARMELDRLNAGCVDVPVLDFNQDLMIGDLDSEFWQGVGTDNVWSVVGDPGVLDSMS